MKKQTKMIITIILILLVAIFAVLNINTVQINFGFGKLELPMIIMLVLWILIGALISFLLSTSNNISMRKQRKIAEKKIQTLQGKINALNAKIDHYDDQENADKSSHPSTTSSDKSDNK